MNEGGVAPAPPGSLSLRPGAISLAPALDAAAGSSRTLAAVTPLPPATRPRPSGESARMLEIDPSRGTIDDSTIERLPALLREGDLVLVNDAATLPASLRGTTERGEPIEVRLADEEGDAAGCGEARLGEPAAAEARGPREQCSPWGRSWRAVVFGAGDWRWRTEDRPAPPLLDVGETLVLGDRLRAHVTAVSSISPRLVTIRFEQREPADFWRALFRDGHPVQYSYLEGPLALWDVQSVYAGPPVAVEPPSAGLLLCWRVLAALRERGVVIEAVTHAAGLSSTGDGAIDAALPLPERFTIPARAARSIEEARRRRGARIVAVGTSVVRAVEGMATRHGGAVMAGSEVTDLRIGPGHVLQVVDGLLTGMHEPGASHYDMLQAFAPRNLLDRAHEQALRLGYQGHEFGDGMLILPSR